MRILELRAENFKRLSVVQITPEGNLVQITGANANGKTSVLDAIESALGGKDAAPAKPIRTGHKTARTIVKLGDGDGPKLIVERTFTEKDTYLTVKGADGAKYSSPQRILDDLIGAVAFDPLAFMRMEAKKQAETLRRLVKFEVDIDALDRKRATIFENRTGTNRDLARAKARAEAIIVPADLPDEPPNVQEITDRLTGASEHNAEVGRLEAKHMAARDAVRDAKAQVEECRRAMAEADAELEGAETALRLALATPLPERVDAAAVRAELDVANRIAEGLRKQQAKIDADAEATTLARTAEEQTAAIEAIDTQKADVLAKAEMPVKGLSFAEGVVTFEGIPLSQASSAQQLRVSAAIGAAANPKLRVLLARDGSLLDKKSLGLLAEFAAERDLQIWLERVDESGEVGIVMEDGHVRGQEALVAEQEKAGDTPAEPSTPAPDEARTARAREYLAGMLAALATRQTVIEADKDNAAVKVKLKAFPDMIAKEWTPAYLARVKAITAKK